MSKAGIEKKDDNDQSHSPPIFSLKKIDLERRLQKLSNKGKTRYIQKVAISSGVAVFGVGGGSVIRWKLSDLSKEPEEIEISGKSDDVIEQIFLDPMGVHCLVVFKSGDTFYLHGKLTKVKKLSKFQGNIECVAFDKNGASENSTKSMLVGTSLGCLYEVIIESSGKEKFFQMIHQINPPVPINSVYFDLIIPEANSSDADRLYVLFSTDTPTRLYHVVGGPSLHQLFSEFSQIAEIPFIELPGEISRASLLCFSRESSTSAETFALLTGAGIYHGSLKEIRSGSDNLLTEAHILPYVEPISKNPNFQYEIEGVYRKPIAISVSQFHFILLRGDRLQYLSSLNGELVLEHLFRTSDGIPIDLIRDPLRNITYFYTNGSIFQVITTEEDRDVWSTFLTKALATGDDSLFDLAFQHSKTLERKNAVARARAEFYFKEQKYEKAALYFAHCGLNFEEAALKLLGVNDSLSVLERFSSISPLTENEGSISSNNNLIWLSGTLNLSPIRVYLVELLKLIPSSSKSQRTILCTWLCEIYLHQITETGSAVVDQSAQLAKATSTDLYNELTLFLKSNRNSLDFATVLQLIINRNSRKLLLFYAKIMGDYHRVINMLLTEKRYDEALAVVQDAPFEKVSNFIYKVMPIFFEMIPERTVNVVLAKSTFSIPSLIPAILRYTWKYDESHAKATSIKSTLDSNYAIVCIEEILKKSGLCFDKCPEALDLSAHHPATNIAENVNVEDWVKSETESVTLHLMCHLYAKYDESKEEKKISNFLHTLLNLQELAVLIEIMDIDLEYLLRQHRMYQRRRGSMYCLLLLKDFKEALTEALAIDVDLAKSVARRQEDAVLRKDLWIIIAIHLVSIDADARKIVALVKESNNDIQIEDLLPYLPDFTEIDNFREDICKSLASCSSRINAVKADMQHLLETAENTMQELESMKTRGYSTNSNHERCDLCFEGLMGHQFYLFPCSHGFHSSCLLKEAHRNLSPQSLTTLKTLEDSLKAITSRGKDLDSRARSMQESMQQELDGYIAADCPLCGFMMINSLGLSLISLEEHQLASLWSL